MSLYLTGLQLFNFLAWSESMAQHREHGSDYSYRVVRKRPRDDYDGKKKEKKETLCCVVP